MHGVPGRQSNEHHTGQEGQNRLWFDPENITKFERDWTTIASAFRSEPAVAALDLMNEPMGAPNPAMLFLVYDRVIRAIRKVAPKKVVLVEDGYKGLETTPLPNIPGWTHVGFSLHFYDFGAKSPSDHVTSLKAQMPKLKELLWYRNAPMYAGEFNLEPFNSPEAMKSFVNVFDGADWSWALWTYKVVPPGGPMGDWGLFRAKGLVRALNAFVDSETELIQKMKQFRTENLTAPTALVGALRRG